MADSRCVPGVASALGPVLAHQYPEAVGTALGQGMLVCSKLGMSQIGWDEGVAEGTYADDALARTGSAAILDLPVKPIMERVYTWNFTPSCLV